MGSKREPRHPPRSSLKQGPNARMVPGHGPEARGLAQIGVRLLLVAAVAVYALYAASEQVTGADLWWTMAAGRYIVDHGAVPRQEVFSYTYDGAPWFNQEWLSQVFYYQLYRAGGGLALALFKFAAVLAGVEALKLGPSRPRARWLVAAIVGAGLACLANPRHLQALTLPFVMLGRESAWRREIIEWLPPDLFRGSYLNPAFFGYFLAAQVLVAVTAAIAAPRQVDVGDALVVAVTAAMALAARRFVPLFGFVSVPFGAKNLALVRERWLAGRTGVSVAELG